MRETRERVSQVAKQIAVARNSSNIEYDLIEMNRQTEKVEVEWPKYEI
jgi:hypothetical protein